VRRHAEIFAKATRAATVLVGGILLCASSGWMDPAVALILRVDASGTFESGAPFAVSFLVNTNTTPVLHQNVQGLAVVGYADAAISGFSVNVEGVSFPQSDIQDRVAVAGAPGAAVFFSQDLVNGATPSISMFLKNDNGELEIGGVVCGLASVPPCQFTNLLRFEHSAPHRFEIDGIVSVQVTGFTGIPGGPNCHAESASGLSKQFGSLSATADALGFANVNALHNAIQIFCGN
jgi:hypothetical protein